jgi:hypothetical protein
MLVGKGVTLVRIQRAGLGPLKESSMKRALGVWMLVLAVVSLPLATTATAGAQPAIYHTIVSEHGFLTASTLQGCARTTVFVSSSVAMYASQPGPVNKQGLTSVLVQVTDACSSPSPAPAAGAAVMAAGGGEPVLYEAQGQSLAPLEAAPRLGSARVSTTIATADVEGSPIIDSDGNQVTIVLHADWTGVGPLEHSTGHDHTLFPGEGVVSSTGNNLVRAATAHVAVTAGPAALEADTVDAGLEQIKSRCVEVARPGVDEFFPCFGFPG